MYELLILAENHPDQSRWASEVSSSLTSLFSNIWVHQYRHWEDPQLNDIDLAFEHNELKSLNKITNKTIVLGKSAGVVLAAMAYSQRIITSRYAIFVGTPLHWARNNDFAIEELLRDVKIVALFIQNDMDPVCSVDELSKTSLLSSGSIYHIVTLDGSSHDYEDLVILREVISLFLDENQ